jgi:hypothetical protein
LNRDKITPEIPISTVEISHGEAEGQMEVNKGNTLCWIRVNLPVSRQTHTTVITFSLHSRKCYGKAILMVCI